MPSYEQHMKVWMLRYATVSKCYFTSDCLGARIFESTVSLGLETAILLVLKKDEIHLAVSCTLAVPVMWSMAGKGSLVKWWWFFVVFVGNWLRLKMQCVWYYWMFMPMWYYLFLKKRITEQVGVQIMPWSFIQGSLIQILAGLSPILRFF